MAAQTQLPSLLSRTGAVSALTIAAVGGSLLVPGGTAEAHAASGHAAKALKVAASKRGSPYRWGATGPNRFDCSGLTQYAFKRAGKRLPRTAQAQYNRTRHIPASRRSVGDLVFFHWGGAVYHVGIYAGHGKMWHSPKTGSVVKLSKIWAKNVRYGRVR
ncbi:C40 family peptidase [Streptomyces sp. FIT100]|uniref:C40 family peptidase n=1 Tax=Streptomyces sp. FIT100 TaxID=2837956 RepID=UPI0021C755B9|nr:C40 family peptidase [Streptomyces sp. FIT100]UUN25514.1 C40 family peptidase [Streptomyces sp. FIT100]